MADYKFEIWQKTTLIDRAQIILNYQGRSKFSSEIERIIFESFTGKENYPIVNLQAVRYNRDAQAMYLDVGESLFAEHAVLNKTSKIPNGKEIALESRVLPLTVMGVSITRDEKIIFSSRSQKGTVTIAKTSLLPGGYMHTWDRSKDNKLDPYEVASREFVEETGVARDLISSLKSCGLIYSDDVNRGFTMPLELKLSVESGFVEERYKESHDPETEDIHTIPFEESSLIDFINSRWKGMSNHALGTLLLVGNNSFGDEWYNRMLSKIRENYGPVLELPEGIFRDRKDVRDIVKSFHT